MLLDRLLLQQRTIESHTSKGWESIFRPHAPYSPATYIKLFMCEWCNVQGILSKFEFLPIRCKVQRAAEFFTESTASTQDDTQAQIPSKVRFLCLIPLLPATYACAFCSRFMNIGIRDLLTCLNLEEQALMRKH